MLEYQHMRDKQHEYSRILAEAVAAQKAKDQESAAAAAEKPKADEK